MRIGFGSKLAYGVGSMPYAAKDAAFGTFVLFYYTQVLELSGSLTGLAIFLSVLWDAVSDPLVGSWSDRLRSRWGRRHPAMILGLLPLALSFVLLFAPPETVRGTQVPLFVWLLVCVLMMRTFLTVFYIPQNAMGAELTDDYHERSSIVNFRTNLGWMGGVILPAICLALLFGEVGGVDGRMIDANYFTYGWASFGVVMVAGAICIAGSWRFIPRLKQVAERSVESPGFLGMVRDTVATLRNLNFRRIFIFEIAVGGVSGILGALQMITWTYFWELSVTQISFLAVASLTAVAVTFPGMRFLSQRWEKQTLLKFAVAGLVFNSLWFVPGRLLDVLPDNGTVMLYALVWIQTLINTGLTILRTVNLHSIMADIADEHELDTGRRQEGVFFAASTFALKFVMGFGYMIGGPLLDIVGLSGGVAPGEASASALFGIGLVIGPAVVLLLLIPWWMAARIDVSREKLDAVQSSLQDQGRLQGEGASAG